MAKRLTPAAVARLKPGAKRRSIPDGGGLYLLIQPSGHKSWAMFFRGGPKGKMRKFTLGPYSAEENSSAKPIVGAPLTLAGARKLAADINHGRAAGEDVVAHRQRERAAREAAAANTFAVAARDFISEHAMPKVRGWREQARLLGLKPSDNGGLEEIKGGLCVRWRDRAIGSVDADDIHAVVDETRRRGAPGLERRSEGKTESRARSMHRTLSKMFNWLVAQRRVKANPCAGIAAPETPRARQRTLSDDEIRKFWAATEKLSIPFRAVLRLCLLTGQRLNEMAGLRRDELVGLNFEEIHLPPARTKNHRPHVVPLPAIAREIIAAVGPFPGGSAYLFTFTGATPVSGWSKVKKRLDALMGDDLPPWRIHDLRRTAVTGMARAGADLPVIERAVNHVSGSFGGVVGTYQTHRYRGEVAAALTAWSDLLARIVEDRRGQAIAPVRRM
jgi:integrase